MVIVKLLGGGVIVVGCDLSEGVITLWGGIPGEGEIVTTGRPNLKTHCSL